MKKKKKKCYRQYTSMTEHFQLIVQAHYRHYTHYTKIFFEASIEFSSEHKYLPRGIRYQIVFTSGKMKKFF